MAILVVKCFKNNTICLASGVGVPFLADTSFALFNGEINQFNYKKIESVDVGEVINLLESDIEFETFKKEIAKTWTNIDDW